MPLRLLSATPLLLLAASCQTAKHRADWHDSVPSLIAFASEAGWPQDPETAEQRAERIKKASRKTDTIVFENGDQVTGEIKLLDRGRLSVSTEGMETVSIEWTDLVRITSRYHYRIELSDGTEYDGSFRSSDQDKILVVGKGKDLTRIEWDTVVIIDQVEEKLRERFKGHLTAGFSYVKASDIGQFTFGSGLSYQTQHFVLSATANSIVTSQDPQSTSKRGDASLGYQHRLGHRWYAGLTVGAERNDELGIDLRTPVTVSAGHAIIQSNWARWTLTAGLSGNHEDYTGGGSQQNLEGLLATEFEIFKYDTPKTDLAIKLDAYPSLTDPGRWRLDFNTRLRQEFVKDFFWDLTLYANYDSGPPAEDAENLDYGIVTSLGYSF